MTAQEGLGPLDPQESPLWTLQHLGFVPDVAAALPTAERTVTPGGQEREIQIDGGGAIREQVRDLLAGLRPDLRMPGRAAETPDVALAYCPERALPGRILVELTNNDRSIGGFTPRCAR